MAKTQVPTPEVSTPGRPTEITPGPLAETTPRVGIIMGSQSDWPTLTHAAEMLTRLAVSHEVKIISAHRTPDRLRDYAIGARDRGLKVIIAGAGGAAHLPGMCASWTSLPVLGVPIESQTLRGIDSLLSIVQMPAGIPVGTLAIGRAGASNAALLAAAILATHDGALASRLDGLRADQTAGVPDAPSPLTPASLPAGPLSPKPLTSDALSTQTGSIEAALQKPATTPRTSGQPEPASPVSTLQVPADPS